MTVLAALTDSGELHRVELRGSLTQHGPGRRQLDRGRRRETGALREAGVDHPAQATGTMARLGQRPSRRDNVVGPRTRPRRPVAQLERAQFAGVEPRQLDALVVTGNVGNANLAIDRDRQDEPIVDIGVLADEVDPSGRPDHPDRPRVRGGCRNHGGEGGGDARDPDPLVHLPYPRA